MNAHEVQEYGRLQVESPWGGGFHAGRRGTEFSLPIGTARAPGRHGLRKDVTAEVLLPEQKAFISTSVLPGASW